MLEQKSTNNAPSWSHTPPEKQTTAERFDKDAIQDILQTAARLQQAEQDTLSREEIEAMAAEMGISPRHVRRAIALSGRQSVGIDRFRRIRLSQREKTVTTAIILFYTVLMTALAVVFNTHRDGSLNELILLSVFIAPQALAFWLGTQVRYKRAGAVCGALLLFFMFVGMTAITWLTTQENMLAHEGLWYMLLLISGAAVLGFCGAALRQWLGSRKISYMVPALKPSDLDR